MSYTTAIARLDAVLAAHVCDDDKERRDVAFIRSFLHEHADAFSRTCTQGHVTGSALILHPPTGRVLLTHHRKLNIWVQCGGHMEDELDPADTALREANEESGLPDLVLASRTPLDIDVHVFPARGATPEHFHLDVRYLAFTSAPERADASHESHEIRWFTIEECDALALGEDMKRLLRKALTFRASSSTPRIPDAPHP
jgi:8-oxo-dGTP pyrophosphatase MutT (NUDIX family)